MLNFPLTALMSQQYFPSLSLLERPCSVFRGRPARYPCFTNLCLIKEGSVHMTWKHQSAAGGLTGGDGSFWESVVG